MVAITVLILWVVAFAYLLILTSKGIKKVKEMKYQKELELVHLERLQRQKNESDLGGKWYDIFRLGIHFGGWSNFIFYWYSDGFNLKSLDIFVYNGKILGFRIKQLTNIV